MVYYRRMSERKNQEKIKPLPELEKVVTEILVANGRSVEPFIRTFSATGENVSKVNLGTLLGVFEVDEKSDDSAYIVNFLASVAKKEYFSNPRRGAVESFEAALHKINLALAELVKHGNVTWLGKFHGALGVLEKNHLHFSVTGKAQILLLRNSALADISEGLASPESHIHPIKTFVEVSSGKLKADDQVLFSSPELFALFSLEDLEKSVQRIGKNRFPQFLKTALINELDMSGTLVIDLKESTGKAPAKASKNTDSDDTPATNNVFSQSAFFSKSQAEVLSPQTVAPIAPPEETLSQEYTDSKTGHIYVQGDTPQTAGKHPFFEHFHLALLETSHSLGIFFASQGKHLRKIRKQSSLALTAIAQEGGVAIKRTLRALRRNWRRSLIALQKKEAPQVTESRRDIFEPTKQPVSQPARTVDVLLPDFSSEEVLSPVSPETPPAVTEEPSIERTEEVPAFIKEKIALFYRRKAPAIPEMTDKKNLLAAKVLASLKILSARWWKIAQQKGNTLTKWLVTLWRFILESFSAFVTNISLFYRELLPLHKKIVLGGIFLACSALAVTVFFLRQPKNPENAAPTTPPTEQAAAVLSLADENNAHLIGIPIHIATATEKIVVPLILTDTPYLVTTHAVVEATENKTYPLPEGESARYATAMDDLRLVFVYTENRRLFAWSPISHTFVENTLALPEGVTVTSIGTYLTYLYVLDSATNQIYRFPRAVGGFGASVLWLRDTVAIEDTTQMAVNETIFLAPTTSLIRGFFRGRLTVTLQDPKTPLALTLLYTHSRLANVYALDRENKRVLVWNQDGRLLNQYFHEKIGEATALTVNEKNNELFLATDNELLSFKMNP